MSIKNAVKLIEESEARFVDLRFTDTKGKQHHFTVPARIVLEDPEEWFENGQAFDGSSIGGWKGIQASDMQLRPDASTAFVDPFYDDVTVVITCDVIDPADGQGYDRDPRSIARRAEAYLKSSGIGDTAYFGPEPELCTKPVTKSRPKAAHGQAVCIWMVKTPATALPSKAVMRPLRRLIAVKTCAPRW